MRYTVDKPPFPGGCQVFGADGTEYFRVLEFDDETGIVTRQEVDQEGHILIDPDTDWVLKEEVQAILPLRIVPLDRSAPPDSRHGNTLGVRYKGCTCKEWACWGGGCPVHTMERLEWHSRQWRKRREKLRNEKLERERKHNPTRPSEMCPVCKGELKSNHRCHFCEGTGVWPEGKPCPEGVHQYKWITQPSTPDSSAEHLKICKVCGQEEPGSYMSDE